jgi:hypothetical protein
MYGKRGKAGRAMSRTLETSALAGQATVRFRDGSVYVGHVSCDRHLVTVAGRRRVVSMVGGERTVTYRPASRRTVSSHRVDWIAWDAV